MRTPDGRIDRGWVPAPPEHARAHIELYPHRYSGACRKIWRKLTEVLRYHRRMTP